MHEGEIFDIRQVSCLWPDADFQIGKLFRECAAPCRGVADMLVEVNDEQRHNRLLHRTDLSIFLHAAVRSKKAETQMNAGRTE